MVDAWWRVPNFCWCPVENGVQSRGTLIAEGKEDSIPSNLPRGRAVRAGRDYGEDGALSNPLWTAPMTAAAISDMKCWAAAMLVFAILSGNLAIFITGIIGSSMVLCCASGNEQVARNASCFKGCAIACAVLGGLHALVMLVLGVIFVGIAADCTDKLKGNSCDHLDGRRQLGSEPTQGVAAALATLVNHAPLLFATVTGGASLVLPSASLGAALAKSPDSAPALAIAGANAGPAGSRRLTVGLVPGCGDRIGEWYLLAKPGASDCTGCGDSLTSYDHCKEASLKLSMEPPLDDISDGPNGCSIEGSANFKFKECGERGRLADRTPVCKCEFNDAQTAPRLPCRMLAPGTREGACASSAFEEPSKGVRWVAPLWLPGAHRSVPWVCE